MEVEAPARHWALFALGFMAIAVGPKNANAQLSVASDLPRDAVRGRVLISEFFTADTVTGQNISRTDLRLVLDASTQKNNNTELHVDGRARFALDNASATRRDITHLYLLQRFGRIRVALGRVNALFAGAAQTDGGYLGYRATKSLEVGSFFGLAPHPLTGDFDSRFQIVGAGYQSRSQDLNHAGSVRLQLYKGEGDRFALSEQFFWRAGKKTNVSGRLVFDLMTPNQDNASSLDKIGLTNAFLSANHRASEVVDFRLGASHVHTVLPNRWWTDWVEQERARLGFSLDGPRPVGSRRSNVRLATNLHVSPHATPYTSLRYDYRHEDQASGYEGKGGLKLNSVETGYLDLFLAHRDYFGRTQQLAGFQSSLFLSQFAQLDAGMMALRVKSFSNADRSGMLYDLNAGIWTDLGHLTKSLTGIKAYGTYQAFIDPEMIFHSFFLRLSYDFARG